ncbi:MAG: recombinase family protein [Oscillospiraceae bacterium]
MRFFIYSRKSVYTGKGESIENQIEMCKQYIHTKFPDDAAEISVYEDEGFSAKNMERPQFQQMLRDMKQKKPDFIICYRLDRISRNVSDFSSLVEDLNDRSISLVCIKEEFDTSKPMGKAMMYIASVFAQLERETIAERVRDNLMMLARTGRWLGGTTPTGFTSEKLQEIVIDGKIKTSCKLKDNPEELRAVDMMFEKYLEVRSVSGVSKYLIKQGIKSRNGKYYSLLGIKDILQNPVYCIADRDALAYFTEHGSDVCFDEKDCSDKYGLISYNKRDYKKKSAPRQSMDKWIIAIGKHKGRISGKKWVAVQNILEENIPTGKKPAKMHNDYALLSGLIWCSKCGNRMFAKRRSYRSGDTVLYDYVCQSKLRGGTGLCDCPNLGGQQADDLVCQHLMQYTNESSSIYQLLEGLKNDLRAQEHEDPIHGIEQRMKKCSDEMDNLVQTVAAGNLGPAFVQRVNVRINELDKELTELSKERDQLRREEECRTDRELQVDTLAAMLSSLKDNFDVLSVHEKRTLIRLLVKKIVWDGEDLHIFMDGG